MNGDNKQYLDFFLWLGACLILGIFSPLLGGLLFIVVSFIKIAQKD